MNLYARILGSRDGLKDWSTCSAREQPGFDPEQHMVPEYCIVSPPQKKRICLNVSPACKFFLSLTILNSATMNTDPEIYFSNA